ncbi:MAG: protein TonB [Maribacter sp.]|jgi:protein TonB
MKKLILAILPILFISFTSFAQNELVADASTKSNKYNTSENDATYIGESNSATAFMADNFEYPMAAKEAGTSGKVQVRILVRENGTPELYNVEGIKDASIIEEITSVIAEMPNWKPAKKNGKTVKQVVKFKMDLRLD